eukprot:3167290-Pleurochrysis_carterae.AAC.2
MRKRAAPEETELGLGASCNCYTEQGYSGSKSEMNALEVDRDEHSLPEKRSMLLLTFSPSCSYCGTLRKEARRCADMGHDPDRGKSKLAHARAHNLRLCLGLTKPGRQGGESHGRDTRAATAAEHADASHVFPSRLHYFTLEAAAH